MNETTQPQDSKGIVMNTQSAVLKVVVGVLALIGLITVIGFIGMAGMHYSMGTMTGTAGMSQWMASVCGPRTNQ